MVELKDVTFSYRKGVPALIDATAIIFPGINLLLGPNGAGKTTLLRILSTTLPLQSGSYTLNGCNVGQRLPSDLQRIFYLSEDEIFPFSTLNDMVVGHAPFYPSFSIGALRTNLNAFGMTGDELIANMSLGQRKKANIAYALALNTNLLLLDEPTNGMDIGSKKIFNQLLASNYQEDQTIIIATHTVHDMKNLFDGVIMLNQGKIELCATVEQITDALTFITSSSLPGNAIYYEPDLQGFRAIVINENQISESNIDYVLLYDSLLSPQGPEIINLIDNNNLL